MIKIKDYPFVIIRDTKVGKISGKAYQSISIGHTVVKDRNATDPKEKYNTEWFQMFDERDLLVLGKACFKAYDEIKKDKMPDAPVNPAPAPTSEVYPEVGPERFDEIPF